MFKFLLSIYGDPIGSPRPPPGDRSSHQAPRPHLSPRDPYVPIALPSPLPFPGSSKSPRCHIGPLKHPKEIPRPLYAPLGLLGGL